MHIITRGFRLFAVNFIFAGMSIFLSSFLTALNNSLIPAVLSFCRVFVFQIPAVLLMPLLWNLDVIWISFTAAELMTGLPGCFFLLLYRMRYRC